jgi:hypothetical protein
MQFFSTPFAFPGPLADKGHFTPEQAEALAEAEAAHEGPSAMPTPNYGPSETNPSNFAERLA